MFQNLTRMFFALLALSPSLGIAQSISGKVKLPGGQSAEGSVVYVAAIPGKTFPPPSELALMDQKAKAFVPHVLVVQKGQRVRFPNSDLMRHNVFSPSKTKKFNLGIYPPGQQKEEVFDQVGVVALLCNVHPEMSGYIVVVETPYHALVGADGAYELEGVPPGKYELVAWHEGLPEVKKNVEVKSEKLTADFTLTKR